jgi:uncharacterized damage-inducible protein DinB
MFKTLDDFFNTFKKESGVTQNVFDAINDSTASQEICEGHRSIKRIAWHICTTYPEMMSYANLKFDKYDKDAPVPESFETIKDAYRDLTSSLLEMIKRDWTDARFEETADFYGEEWKLGNALAILILHEVHHRGQLTVLMRQADVVVPDLYGPAKEGWANYDMTPPEV